MTEAAVPIRPVRPVRNVLLHVGVFAALGPLVGFMGGLLFFGLSDPVAGMGYLAGVGARLASVSREDILFVSLLAYPVGVVPAALTGAAVGWARNHRPAGTWLIAVGTGLLTPMLAYFVIGFFGQILAASGLIASLVCTCLTAPLARRT